MIKVEKIIPGGESLATDEFGKKLFFWNALPDEEVLEYQITKKKSHYNRAIATKIANTSPHRVEPKDNCYLSTSPWQIMDYDYELLTKQALVKEVFHEHQIEIELPEIITDNNQFYYRNKMEYSLYYDHDSAEIFPAFHQRGSHRKIPITQSSIERPEIFAAAKKIISELNQNGDEARRYQSLLLRCNQKGEVSGGLYENGKPHPVFPNLTDDILGHKYSYSPNGFFQINLPVYELALKEITKHINTNKVLDLYAGVGTIGLSVARDRELTLVECDKFAFSELLANTNRIKETSLEGHIGGCYRDVSGPSPVKTGARNHVPEKGVSLIPILAKSEDVLNYITPDQTVILDPPRAGCDAKLIQKLLEVQPPKIVYLSCNPATQARDIKILLDKYHIDTIKTFNFFPRTPHIENLVVLSL